MSSFGRSLRQTWPRSGNRVQHQITFLINLAQKYETIQQLLGRCVFTQRVCVIREAFLSALPHSIGFGVVFTHYEVYKAPT